MGIIFSHFKKDNNPCISDDIIEDKQPSKAEIAKAESSSVICTELATFEREMRQISKDIRKFKNLRDKTLATKNDIEKSILSLVQTKSQRTSEDFNDKDQAITIINSMLSMKEISLIKCNKQLEQCDKEIESFRKETNNSLANADKVIKEAELCKSEAVKIKNGLIDLLDKFQQTNKTAKKIIDCSSSIEELDTKIKVCNRQIEECNQIKVGLQEAISSLTDHDTSSAENGPFLSESKDVELSCSGLDSQFTDSSNHE